MATNTDRLIEHIIKNSTKLTADKITALAAVVTSLGGDRPSEPNDITALPDLEVMGEEKMSLRDIEKIQLEGVGERNITIE